MALYLVRSRQIALSLMNVEPVDRTQTFVSLLLKAEPQLYGYLRTQLLDRNDVDDLFQETAAVLWKKFGEFEPGTNFAAWAHQIARNKVLNYYKTRGRDRKRFSSTLLEMLEQKSQAIGAEANAMRMALAECLQKLPSADRDLLHACYAAGATVRGVAETSGRPFDTVKSVLKRSRRALLLCIQRTLAREDR